MTIQKITFEIFKRAKIGFVPSAVCVQAFYEAFEKIGREEGGILPFAQLEPLSRNAPKMQATCRDLQKSCIRACSTSSSARYVLFMSWLVYLANSMLEFHILEGCVR